MGPSQGKCVYLPGDISAYVCAVSQGCTHLCVASATSLLPAPARGVACRPSPLSAAAGYNAIPPQTHAPAALHPAVNTYWLYSMNMILYMSIFDVICKKGAF